MLDVQQIAMLVLAVCLTGLSKGGFAGLGMIATPLLATVMEPILAVSVMLPILLAQDGVSTVVFRRAIDWRVLKDLIPGAAAGIALGYLLASWMNAHMVSGLIGAIAVVFAVYFVFVGAKRNDQFAKRRAWLAFTCGAGSGFASMIAHAGTPPFQIYVLPQRLPRDVFVATSVYFFASINAIKVVPYLMLGQLSLTSLTISVTMVPISLLATLAGIWIVRRFDTDRFYTVICFLLGAVGLKLIYDAWVALL